MLFRIPCGVPQRTQQLCCPSSLHEVYPFYGVYLFTLLIPPKDNTLLDCSATWLFPHTHTKQWYL